MRVWSTHLRPQGGLHVLPERGDRVSGEPIDAAGDSFNVAALMELGQAHLQHPRFQGLWLAFVLTAIELDETAASREPSRSAA